MKSKAGGAVLDTGAAAGCASRVASELRALAVLAVAAAVALFGAQLALHRAAWRADAMRRVCRDDERPGAAARAWSVVRESALALLVLLAWPFGAAAPAPERRPPVVLLHGFLSCPASLWVLARRLRRDGWLVIVPRLGAYWRDLDDGVARLAWRLERVRAVHGAADLVVVAHGVTGLAARLLVRREGRHAGVRLLMTLGTPHAGTDAAPWCPLGPFRRDVRPGSEALRALARHPLPARVEAIAIASPDDALIVPSDHAYWPEACTVSVERSGHLHLLVSARVYAVVAENLAVVPTPAAHDHAD